MSLKALCSGALGYSWAVQFLCASDRGVKADQGAGLPHTSLGNSKFNWGCLEEEQASSKKSRLSASLYIS